MPTENDSAAPVFDRRAEARLRPDWLAEARRDQRTLYLGMRASATLVREEEGAGLSRLALIEPSDPRIAAVEDPERLVLLGWYEERRCVLVDLPEEEAALAPGEAFADLRPLVAQLPAGEAQLAAYARALNLWREYHRHCGRCGSPTVAQRAGHLRHCPACGHQSFPRLDPAIIVLVQAGDRALLGRQASWAAGRYSTIAGFVEPGETLEDAVRREVREEAGIAVRGLAYHSSQPWPFPSSLMLGFIAEADHAPPVLHDGELEDARWFTRAELRSGAVTLPPAQAISRRLIDDWLARDEPR